MKAEGEKARPSGNTFFYEALNPRGLKPTITMFSLSPRVTDLNQSVVYLIDSGIFGSYIFTEKMEVLLRQRFPQIKVVYKKTDSLFLSPDSELWAEMKKDADAFVFGPAGGTNGFMIGARWSIFLEKMGIPGLYVLSEGYEGAVQASCEKEGMPLLRRVVTPMPAWGEESLGRSERIFDEIIMALTTPLTPQR